MCSYCGCDVQIPHSPGVTARWQRETSGHPETPYNGGAPGSAQWLKRGVKDESGLGQHAQSSGKRQGSGHEKQRKHGGR